MQKSVAVLGLGKYGTSLAKSLYEMGTDVLVADRVSELVREAAEYSSAAVCAELTSEEDVLNLDLKNMDIVVTAMGENLEASILCVVIAKEQGVPLVVAKCSTERMASILRKVGADKTIIPEEESGRRSARILINDHILDYFQVGNNISMVEMKPYDEWVGKNLTDLHLRSLHHLNVVAVKEGDSDQWKLADPSTPMTEKSKLLIVMENSVLQNLK